MLVNTLVIKYTVLESTISRMAIVTKDHGMKDKGKDMAHILSETVRRNVANGMVGASSILSHH